MNIIGTVDRRPTLVSNEQVTTSYIGEFKLFVDFCLVFLKKQSSLDSKQVMSLLYEKY